MDEEPEPERLPLQFDNYPADLLMSLGEFFIMCDESKTVTQFE